jgi:AcrR family transcriptional regulator
VIEQPATRRRSQQERREGTIRKLLDAAIDTLIDVGYAEASVQRICARAELSQGALFRHFPTREALMVAVGEDVGTELLAAYRGRFLSLPAGHADIATAIRMVRDACRSRLNAAWFELAIAARTSENLRKALEPVARRYYDDITRLARELLPDLAAQLGESFDVLVGTMLAVFDGEVLHRYILKDPHGEDARIGLMTAAVATAAADSISRGRGGRRS